MEWDWILVKKLGTFQQLHQTNASLRIWKTEDGPEESIDTQLGEAIENNRHANWRGHWKIRNLIDTQHGDAIESKEPNKQESPRYAV